MPPTLPSSQFHVLFLLNLLSSISDAHMCTDVSHPLGYGNLPTVMTPKERDSAFFSNHQLLIAPLPRVEPQSPLPCPGTGLILCGDHSSCYLMCVIAMSIQRSASHNSPPTTSARFCMLSTTLLWCSLSVGWGRAGYGCHTHSSACSYLYSVLWPVMALYSSLQKRSSFDQNREQYKSMGINTNI